MIDLDQENPNLRQRIMLYLPLIIMGSVLLLFVVSLGLGDRGILPSALIDQAVPTFSEVTLIEELGVTEADLPDTPYLINAWASWCGPCRIEHPVILEAAESGYPIVGVNVKDDRDKAIAWLNKYGNAYQFSIVDQDGRLRVDLGLSGVPSTFIVDDNGVIRYKKVGIVTQNEWRNRMLPLLESFEDSTTET